MDYRIEQLRFQLREDPTSRVFYQLGELLRRETRLDEAVEVLEQGLEHHPKYVAAWVSLGKAHLSRSAYDEATGAFATALELDPENPVAARGSGEAAFRRGDWLAAVKALKLARALSPRDPSLDEQIATVEERLQGETAPAVEPAPEEVAATGEAEPEGASADEVAADTYDDELPELPAGAADVFPTAAHPVQPVVPPDAIEPASAAEPEPVQPVEPPEPDTELEEPVVPAAEEIEDVDEPAPFEAPDEPEEAVFGAEPPVAVDDPFAVAAEAPPGGWPGGHDVFGEQPSEPAAAEVEPAGAEVAPFPDQPEPAPVPVEDEAEVTEGLGPEGEPEEAVVGDTEEADEALTMPTLTLARLAMEQGDHELAESTLLRLLGREPDNSEAVQLLARVRHGATASTVVEAKVSALRGWLEGVRLAAERRTQ